MTAASSFELRSGLMLHANSFLAAVAMAAMAAPFLPPRALAAPGWVADGLPVAPSGSLESDPVIAPDGAGGAFIAWQDYRSGGITLYAQHVTAEGTPAPGWPLDGRAVSISSAYDPMIIADGRGGAFISGADGSAVGVWHITRDGSIALLPRAQLTRQALERTTSPEGLRGKSKQSPAAVMKSMPTCL